MDEQGSRERGRRPDDADSGDERTRETDQEYFWGGKPGEDFGPIAPPGPEVAPRQRPPGSGGAGRDPGDARVAPEPWETRPAAGTRGRAPRDAGVEAGATADPWRTASPADRTARRQAVPLRPDGDFAQAARRRSWRSRLLLLLGGLVVVLALIGGVLYALLSQGLLKPAQEPTPGSVTVPPAGSPIVGASPVPAASPAPAAAAAGSPSTAASPTPLALGPPSPTPLPPRSPVPSATPRPAAAILPTPAAFVTPPGSRFASATPIRIGTPQPIRTAPPIPSPRLPNISTRVWSEQVMHRIGEDASICGQTSAGTTAQLSVIAPDRANRILGEFATPAERVCYAIKLDQPELWVLTLIVKDAGGAEVERQAAALWVSR